MDVVQLRTMAPWLGPGGQFLMLSTDSRPRIAFLLGDARVGGAERVMLTLAGRCAAQGFRVDLVLLRAEGELLSQVPAGVRVVPLTQAGQGRGRGLRFAITALPAMRAYLRRIGVPLDGVLIEDGPGLSRRDLTSPAALASLLSHLGDTPGARAFRLALPEAGVDGSLTGRMRNSPAQGRVHAKTGSMANTYALAGYAVTAANERLAFAIMLNNYRRPSGAGRSTAELDAIAIMLAEIGQRSDP